MEMYLSVAVGLALATFASEDLALLSAVAIAADGMTPPAVPFGAVALGIFVGDLGLFYAGRFGQERADRSRPLGNLGWVGAVIAARFIPGTRFATYVAAGAAGMRPSVFALLTGAAVAVWVGAAAALGTALFQFKADIVPVVAVLAVSLGFYSALRGWPRRLWWVALRAAWYKVARFRYVEFWPAWLFYGPLAVCYAGLALWFRSLTAPLHANPGIATGGVIGESRTLLLEGLPSGDPAMLRFQRFGHQSSPAERLAAVLDWLCDQGLRFPVVLKPDVGQRGFGVHKLDDEQALAACLARAPFPVLVQEYCGMSEEVGISYQRHPDEPRGRVVGITRRRILQVAGDGCRTLAELIVDHPRARFLADVYLASQRERAFSVLAAGESPPLAKADSPDQGALFEDGAGLSTAGLESAIDRLARNVPGFYVGRFDVRFSFEQELQAGRGFKIVGLKGAASEAAHVNGAHPSVASACRILARQLRTLFVIGCANLSRVERREHPCAS